MITLTRLDGSKIMLNEQFIEIAEETPDTIITLNNGHAYIVQESLTAIMQKIQEFYRKIRFIGELE